MLERSTVCPQSSARHPGRTPVQRPQGGPAGVGWKPPGLSMNVVVLQTQVESTITLEALEVAVGHQETVARIARAI